MKILTCMLMMAACVAAQDPAKTAPAKTAPATTAPAKTPTPKNSPAKPLPARPLPAKPAPAVQPAKKAPARMEVPKDAVETSPGLYRWTDKDGKVWMYRRSPFGVSRFPSEAKYVKQNAAPDDVRAVEEGDSIRFERDSPFGKRTWVRKKTELNETEQAIWEQQKKTGAADRTAEKE